MVQEGTPIEEAMEEVIGCGTTCMSTLPMEFLCEDQSLRDPRVGRDGGSKCTTKTLVATTNGHSYTLNLFGVSS